MTIEQHPLTPQEFQTLRNHVGWGDITLDTAKAALNGSLVSLALYDGDTLIGCARAVGDGVLNIYIQDVVVKESYRGRGFGKNIVTRLLTALQESYPTDCTIGLMAAKGQDGFYLQYGFKMRPSDVYGAGMIASLGDLRGLGDKG